MPACVTLRGSPHSPKGSLVSLVVISLVWFRSDRFCRLLLTGNAAESSPIRYESTREEILEYFRNKNVAAYRSGEGEEEPA